MISTDDFSKGMDILIKDKSLLTTLKCLILILTIYLQDQESVSLE